MRAIERPIISLAAYPNMRSAPGFQDVTMPCSVLLAIASSALATIAARWEVAASIWRSRVTSMAEAVHFEEPIARVEERQQHPAHESRRHAAGGGAHLCGRRAVVGAEALEGGAQALDVARLDEVGERPSNRQ